jgi:hypothetical protein
MIKEDFKNKIIDTLSKDKIMEFNVYDLISYMEKSDINYYMADLKGPLGLTSLDAIYIDLNEIIVRYTSECSKFLYFIILHETAHMKRIIKMGREEVLRNLSTNNFDDLFEHIIGEELIADKYGSLLYYFLNKKFYPKHYTQQLDNIHVREKYKNNVSVFFGQIQNDETSYYNFVNKFIKKVY